MRDIALKYPHRARYIIATILILVLASVIVGRLYLNRWALDYVNEVLENIPGYQGSVGSIDIDLYRGAYRIHQLKVSKKSGHIPVPFIDIEAVDLSIQWSALLHGRIVSDAELTRPVINFAVNTAGNAEQTGSGVDWSKPIKDLMPIDINIVTFSQGKLTYQDFSTTPKVNIYIHNMQGEVRNLRNIEDATQPLPSALTISGDSIGNGRLDIKGGLNILRRVPDMKLEIQLLKVHLAALSDYSNAYAAVDIKGGNLNLYSELIVKNNRVSGYIKPIATNISLIDLRKPNNPVKLAWETVVSLVVEIFTNQRTDQFATKIPLEGRLDNIEASSWAAIAGIIQNAFFQALHNGLDQKI